MSGDTIVCNYKPDYQQQLRFVPVIPKLKLNIIYLMFDCVHMGFNFLVTLISFDCQMQDSIAFGGIDFFDFVQLINIKVLVFINKRIAREFS